MFQNGRFVGDADLERQKFSDLKLNGPQVIILAQGLGCFIHIFLLPQPIRAFWCFVKCLAHCKHPLITFILEWKKIFLNPHLRIFFALLLERNRERGTEEGTEGRRGKEGGREI